VSISELTIVEQDPGYDIDFAYPQIGIPSADAAVQDWVRNRVGGIEDWAAHPTPRDPPSYSAHLTYAVARNDDRAVSILFSSSSMSGGAAHPSFGWTAFNFLMPDGVRVFLPDVIGNDGVRRVSDLAVADLTRRLTGPDRMSDPDWIRSGAGPYAETLRRSSCCQIRSFWSSIRIRSLPTRPGRRRCGFHSRRSRICCGPIRGRHCPHSTAARRTRTSSMPSALT
jgi:hypothetical protein